MRLLGQGMWCWGQTPSCCCGQRQKPAELGGTGAKAVTHWSWSTPQSWAGFKPEVVSVGKWFRMCFSIWYEKGNSLWMVVFYQLFQNRSIPGINWMIYDENKHSRPLYPFPISCIRSNSKVTYDCNGLSNSSSTESAMFLLAVVQYPSHFHSMAKKQDSFAMYDILVIYTDNQSPP